MTKEKEKGLYQKYDVTRKDGREISQGSFVLELKDAKARKAILTYVQELEKEGDKLELAYDLKAWVGKYEEVDATVVSKKSPAPNENRDAMLFDRIVLIENDKALDEDTIYIVPPDEVDEYKGDNDLVLPAVLTVDLRLYNEYHEAKAKKEKELTQKGANDPMIDMIVPGVVASFYDNGYTDFDRFWSDTEDKYRAALGDRYDIVGEKTKKVLSKSPNQTN